MSNVDIAILMGNLTRAPELKYTQSGTALCKFGVAVNRRYTVDGEQKEKVAFIDCVAWGKTGELIHKHLRKGSPIFIRGHHSYSSWEKDGQKHSKLEISVDEFKFVGPPADKKSDAAAPAKAGDDVDYGDIPF